MSKIIYIQYRNPTDLNVDERLSKICHAISPDNIIPESPLIKTNQYGGFGIMNPPKSVLIKEQSVLLGELFVDSNDWDTCNSDFPDGSFALFRNDESKFEIVSDIVASRTIWYYFDEDKLIASTSQRAIIMLLESFEFDERVIPWMLSTGSLGPQFSWDKRLKRVPTDASITLNKSTWKLSQIKNEVHFEEKAGDDLHFESNLKNAIDRTFRNLNLDLSKWILPISGGYDSRGILLFLAKFGKNTGLKTITWGLKSSLKVKGNDAFIAKKLVNELNVSHKYYSTDIPDEKLESIIDRFIKNGEGRIDHISGYLDGFKIWKTLFEDGVRGIIRGDEGYGWEDVNSVTAAKHSLDFALCEDFVNLKEYRKFGIPAQEVPENLVKKEFETIAGWRDRIYHEYRLPTILAALSDLKLSYVEQISPLLSNAILKEVRKQPDHLRTDKKLFKKIIDEVSPKINYARSSAIASSSNIISSKPFIELIVKEIEGEFAAQLFSKDFLTEILSGIKEKKKPNIYRIKSVKSFIKRVVPKRILNRVRDSVQVAKIDPYTLAFRVFLIIKMNKLIRKDIDPQFH
ncbi:hypothetical protein MWU59_06840 [Flavobacteriaceae bacterium F08102]|nr:hypothetical protein [Flavobacteriaceae bacterium F08102]